MEEHALHKNDFLNEASYWKLVVGTGIFRTSIKSISTQDLCKYNVSFGGSNFDVAECIEFRPHPM